MSQGWDSYEPGSGDEEIQDPLLDALVEFTGCIGGALDDVCSYGLTIGESYTPFDPDPEDDCDDEEVVCSQAWVRVANINVTELSEGFGRSACANSMSITLEVGVLRCVEIPEDGEAPTASGMLAAAMQAMTDMKKIQCAALACEVWDKITIGSWLPLGPLGGQYGGVWSFTADLV